MKIKPIYLVLALVALLLAACGGETPTPIVIVQTATPETVPTEVPPTVSADPVWDRIVSQGKIIVGTSADYQPFEYYDESFREITGFDIALIRNVAARLGLEVELIDMAFEGLPTALQIGQIDVAIAAISVTPERQAMMDFSNVYYSGQDEILARSGANINPIVTAAQLAPYRVGVQRGSVYATWLQQALVTPGLMPESHLLQYAKAGDAVRDLRENRIDLVVMDKLPADEYLLAGDVISVGSGLNTQLYAVALPKGSPVLQQQINEALTALKNDGTTARLADTFLEIDLPDVTAPVPTAIPGPTATPAACVDALEFVSDISIPDGTRLDPNERFVKVWRIRNTGTCTWDEDYKLVFVQGNTLSGEDTEVTTEVEPGKTYDMAVSLQAGSRPGDRVGQWQMENPDGKPFGERVWVRIRIKGQTAPPTATPVPPQPQNPILPGAPDIASFTATPDTVSAGDVFIVSWDFSGEELVSARITRTNPDGSQTALFGGADVETTGQYEDGIFLSPGQYSYTLTVLSTIGNPAVETIVVTVN